MKQALVKQTAEAVKHFEAATTADGKKSKAVRSSHKACADVDATEAFRTAEGAQK